MVQAARDSGGTPLRLGVIGVGVMGFNHARVITDLPGVTCGGIADPDDSNRRFVAQALGCPAFADFGQLLDHGVDAVAIAAPTHLHRDIALAYGKEGAHVPKVTVEGKNVKVVTPHPMTHKHFIVKHTLMTSEGKFIGEKTFENTDPAAESSYELPEGFKGTLWATSFCNMHDFWLTEFFLR